MENPAWVGAVEAVRQTSREAAFTSVDGTAYGKPWVSVEMWDGNDTEVLND